MLAVLLSAAAASTGSSGLGNGTAPLADQLTAGEALTLLLTAESLLLAALGLIVTLGAPGQVRKPRLPLGRMGMGWLTVAAQMAAGLGAGAAWSEVYVYDFPASLGGQVVAATILAAIIAEAVIAFLLGFGLSTEA